MNRYLGRKKVVKRGEALVIALAGMVLGFLFIHFDAFTKYSKFVDKAAYEQLDELLFVIFFGGFAALVIAIRRTADMAREVRRREEAERKALKLARLDPLTGLPNRRVLGELLVRAVQEAARHDRDCAVLLIDLDHFKSVNDLHGHHIGDALLVEVSNRLRELASDTAHIARLGGDEFACWLSYERGNDAPGHLAMRIIRSLGRRYVIEGRTLEVSATIGIARSPRNSGDPATLLRAADIAMYHAKREQRGTFEYFRTEMDEKLQARAMLERDLRHAVAEGHIIPYFQPIYSLVEDRIIGFEALARWFHPERGLVSPVEFIPVAEDIGLMHDLTQHILTQSCIVAQTWPDGISFSVNVPPAQLLAGWFPAHTLATLTATGVAPSRLIIEVTENAFIEDADFASGIFESLHNAGIRVALDDFGKGYSSLTHLRQLRFDHLKIDSSFIRSIDTTESRQIIKAVIGLGGAMGMSVTAEGVEDEAVAHALGSLGCTHAQGYLFGKPVPASMTLPMLQPRASLRSEAVGG
ncbi:putative bifunctional diguanylate cyclase/phosphodiesterase [Stakelama saccharophila]|uniref:EAL domain-containing protein n=1 Tax=Stakelama saccharophila TaxID=3075605 RepID=A0ABZ0B916_9SPHN|nr:EAL domain-containing protein [Stakelama sp. W311]WNO53611.1 EAL domain-containing protein [Stakelama sp. W311]